MYSRYTYGNFGWFSGDFFEGPKEETTGFSVRPRRRVLEQRCRSRGIPAVQKNCEAGAKPLRAVFKTPVG